MTITREQAIDEYLSGEEFHQAAMDYRGAFTGRAQEPFEALQASIRKAMLQASQPIADVQAESNPSAEAIKFALGDEDGLDFLRYWNDGEFDVCRRLWPDAPLAVYLGADPLFSTVAHRQQQAERGAP